MHVLFAEELADAERWRRVGTLLPMLLDDPELRASAKDWPTTQYGNAATNLLFYEDPERKFVINGLVKDAYAATPIHDHAHTWTAYGVIEGSERVLRYAIAAGDIGSDQPCWNRRANMSSHRDMSMSCRRAYRTRRSLGTAARSRSSSAANASVDSRKTCTISPRAASTGAPDRRRFRIRCSTG